MTPRETGQTRRLVIAFDLAIGAIILNYLALALPLAILILRSTFLDVLTTWLATQALPFQLWFSVASNALSVASAFLFLGAPLRMRCFPEAMAFAVLTLIATLVSSIAPFVTLPTLVAFGVNAISIFFIPIALLLLFRKAAIFVSSEEDLILGRSIARLIFVAAMLVEIGLRLLDVIGYLSLPPQFLPFQVVAPILPLAMAIVCYALVCIRLFRLELSLRRKFRQLCDSATSSKASSTSQNLPNPSTGNVSASEAGRVSPIPFGINRLLAALFIVVLICELGSFFIVRKKELEVQAEEFAASAERFNSEMWMNVRVASAAKVDNEAILKMQSICARLPKWEYLNTLGVAQYRIGDYAAAKDTLERSLNASKSLGDPSDLAFLAMSYHKLGQRDLAANIRSRLMDLMNMDRYKNNPESLQFVREVNELFEADAAQPTKQYGRSRRRNMRNTRFQGSLVSV